MDNAKYYAKIHTVRYLIDNSAEKFGKKPFIKCVLGDEVFEKSFIDLKENSLEYPVVFVHGMFGWGEDEGINIKAPYWGAGNGSIADDVLEW